jgi:hypothetical protein
MKLSKTAISDTGKDIYVKPFFHPQKNNMTEATIIAVQEAGCVRRLDALLACSPGAF